MHAVEYELDWLHEHDISRKASKPVRQQAGHHLKSALSYIYRYHSLNDLSYPTSGIGFRCVPVSLVYNSHLPQVCNEKGALLGPSSLMLSWRKLIGHFPLDDWALVYEIWQ